MALTSTERVTVRNYLGWSERFFQTDTRLEMALNAVDMDVEGLVHIRAEMVKVAAIEDKIQGITDLFKAEQIGSIKLDGAKTLGLMRALGRSSVHRIAVLLGAEIRADYFGSGGPLGMATRDGVFASASGNYLRG